MQLSVLQSNERDPFINLAIEDWLFRGAARQQRILFLYVNRPAVVIGRHQNPYVECDLSGMQRDGVPLVRRHSGGGGVYHDTGNLNFCFLSPRHGYDERESFAIVQRALQRLGVPALRSGRNDLLVDGRKISGSAFRIGRQAAFHHGTLLIETDLARLNRYLIPPPAQISSRGIDSVRSQVVNLRELVGKQTEPTTGNGHIAGDNQAGGSGETVGGIARGGQDGGTGGIGEPLKSEQALVCRELARAFVEFYRGGEGEDERDGAGDERGDAAGEYSGAADVLNIPLVSEADIDERARQYIRELQSDEWRFGKTPPFTHTVGGNWDGWPVELTIEVRRARISRVTVGVGVGSHEGSSQGSSGGTAGNPNSAPADGPGSGSSEGQPGAEVVCRLQERAKLLEGRLYRELVSQLQAIGVRMADEFGPNMIG